MRARQPRWGQTRAVLLQAAKGIAAESGLAGVRAEAVAKRAGTAKGTVSAHFPDKDHLLAALVANRLRALPDPGPVTGATALIAGCRPLLTLLVSEPEVLAVMARFSMPQGEGSGMGEAIHARLAAMAGQIAAMQVAENGALRPLEPALLAEGLMAFAFHAAGSALCAAVAQPRDSAEAVAVTLFARLADAWLIPK